MVKQPKKLFVPLGLLDSEKEMSGTTEPTILCTHLRWTESSTTINPNVFWTVHHCYS